MPCSFAGHCLFVALQVTLLIVFTSSAEYQIQEHDLLYVTCRYKLVNKCGQHGYVYQEAAEMHKHGFLQALVFSTGTQT